jgi:predicted nucleic acid-binding protein
MAILYLDTSALVKQYVQESASNDVQKLIRTADHSGTSLITRAEMAAAMARATRMKLIPLSEGEAAWNEFLTDWSSISRLRVSRQIIDRAGVFAWEYPLRGYDAVHLASAVLWQETLETQITLATFDRELWSAGAQIGLTVWPEALPHK